MFAPKSDPQMQAVAERAQLSEDEGAKIARKAAHERAPVRGTGTPRGDLFGCVRPRLLNAVSCLLRCSVPIRGYQASDSFPLGRSHQRKAPPYAGAGPGDLPIYFDVNAGAPFSPDFHVRFSDTPTLFNSHIRFTDAPANGDVRCAGAVFTT
jgi:hypothetical protein